MQDSANPQPFSIAIEEQATAVLVRCQGKLIAGYADQLYTPVSELLPRHRHVILDLAHLTHMDSMGLGAVVRLYVHAKSRGTAVELRNLSPRIRDLLIRTNLLPVFAFTSEDNIRM
jgi:anti-anti-sigma factor